MNIDRKDNLKSLKTVTNNSIEGSSFSFTFKDFLYIHSHRYSRRAFFAFLMIHTILLPFLFETDAEIQLPHFMEQILQWTANLWPLPTYNMSSSHTLTMRNAFFKIFEISTQLIYLIDLIPKIFCWRKPMAWKAINIIIIGLMVMQIPLAMMGQQSEKSIDYNLLKSRATSVSLSFMILLEINSIRERRTELTQNREEEDDIRFETSGEKLTYPKETKTEDKEYHWAEIIKHDREGDCWVVIHGQVYDVTDFVDKHPGGPLIYDGAGGDCSSVWESYHPLALTEAGPFQKYRIGKVANYVDFYSYTGTFYSSLKEKVEKLIPREKRQNDWKLFTKAALIIIGYWISLYYFITECSVVWSISLAFFSSQIGVNIMHDGNHMSFSQNKTFSMIAGYMLDVIGGTSVVYRRSHDYGHHGCVNHYELDRAFDTTYPLFRLHPFQKCLWYHKFQHIYGALLYGMVNFGDLFSTFDEMYWLSNPPTRFGYLTKFDFWFQVFIKIYYCITILAIPIYNFGLLHVFPRFMLYFMLFS